MDIAIEIMNTQINILELIKNGKIETELDFERALIADRKLRVISKKDQSIKIIREKLRDLIEKYENEHWNADSIISDKQLKENDLAEFIAEKERIFILNRKEIIKKKLRSLNLSQQDFGALLGHNSKSYISELMNGVCPFSMKDLVVIHRLLKIPLTDLVPTFLPQKERAKIKATIKKLDNPKLKLSRDDFEFAL